MSKLTDKKLSDLRSIPSIVKMTFVVESYGCGHGPCVIIDLFVNNLFT